MRPNWIGRVLLLSRAALVVIPVIIAPSVHAADSGKLDRDFGEGGLVEFAWPPFPASYASVVVSQPDGRILLGGGDVDGARVFRFAPDGSLDPTFGDNGTITFSPEGPGIAGKVLAMAVRPDGNIVVAGERNGPDYETWYRYVARLEPDGSLDTGFGTSGFAVVGTTGGFEELADVVLQPDGKIVLGGRRLVSHWVFYLARLREDGSPDPGFGADGEVLTDIPERVRAGVVSVLVQPDGKIVAVGDAVGDVGIARYEPDGTLDASFGVGGVLVSEILTLPKWGALHADGSIVVAGHWTDLSQSSYPDMAVTRFLADGTLDTAFGVDGRATIDFDRNYDAVTSGVILEDGGIVVGGTVWVYHGLDSVWAFGLARLDHEGRLEKRFGRAGRSVVILPEPELLGIALLPDGEILAAGKFFVADGTYVRNTFLARFHQ